MSQFDNLELDDKVLDDVANIIIAYCNTQREIMDDYLRKMNSLSSEWNDDETMGKVLHEVQLLTQSTNKIMDIIRFKYPQYFKKRAEEIRARTKPQI